MRRYEPLKEMPRERRTSHIILHHADEALVGLDVNPTAVKRDPFTDEHKRRGVRRGSPCRDDETWRALLRRTSNASIRFIELALSHQRRG